MPPWFSYFAAIIITVYSLVASAYGCPRTIIFLPQVHPDQLDTGNVAKEVDREMLNQSSHDQYLIAEYLEHHKGIPVFSEATYSQITLPWYLHHADHASETVQRYQTAFSKGLPDSFDDMTADQKWMLAQAGGDLTLLFLNELPAIHAVAPSAGVEYQYFAYAQEWIKNHPGQDLFKDSFFHWIGVTRRERIALGEIGEYFKNHPQNDSAILIFGANHNFQRYPTLFAPQCVLIPQQFLPIYNGRSGSK